MGWRWLGRLAGWSRHRHIKCKSTNLIDPSTIIIYRWKFQTFAVLVNPWKKEESTVFVTGSSCSLLANLCSRFFSLYVLTFFLFPLLFSPISISIPSLTLTFASLPYPVCYLFHQAFSGMSQFLNPLSNPLIPAYFIFFLYIMHQNGLERRDPGARRPCTEVSSGW